jgi:hypothetical protein
MAIPLQVGDNAPLPSNNLLPNGQVSLGLREMVLYHRPVHV